MRRDMENRLRALMGRPARRDSFSEMFVPTDHGTYRMADEDTVQSALDREFVEFHAAGLRDRAAETLAGLPYQARRAGQDAARRLRRLRAERAVSRARHLRFRSYHVHTLGACHEVEGYLETPDGHTLALDVRSQEWAGVMARSSWLEGEIFVEYGGAVVVPEPTLTPELVLEALERWYMQRFLWHRGHWAVREQTLPHFELDVEFRDPEPDEQPGMEVHMLSGLAAHMRQRARELHARFGR